MPHGVQPVVTDGKSTQLNRDLQRNLNTDMIAGGGPGMKLKVKYMTVHKDQFRSNAPPLCATSWCAVFGGGCMWYIHSLLGLPN